jgi:hypothetical protein
VKGKNGIMAKNSAEDSSHGALLGNGFEFLSSFEMVYAKFLEETYNNRLSKVLQKHSMLSRPFSKKVTVSGRRRLAEASLQGQMCKHNCFGISLRILHDLIPNMYPGRLYR